MLFFFPLQHLETRMSLIDVELERVRVLHQFVYGLQHHALGDVQTALVPLFNIGTGHVEEDGEYVEFFSAPIPIFEKLSSEMVFCLHLLLEKTSRADLAPFSPYASLPPWRFHICFSGHVFVTANLLFVHFLGHTFP